jgi:D-amino-acid oxidase
MDDILVIGCGVSGLTKAIQLQEAMRGRPWRVCIWAREPPLQTTSSVAAALWYPYKVAAGGRVDAWGRLAHATFVELARDPRSGVRQRCGIELFRALQPTDPPWRDVVHGFRHARPAELPQGYQDGFVFTVPVIQMPVYLPYLLTRFQVNGGRVELDHPLTSLDEATTRSPIVVNCTGLGARELVRDRHFHPSLGQVVWVANPGLTQFVLDDLDPAGPTYIVPFDTYCVLGGTDLAADWSAPRPEVTEAILRRCEALEPRLQGARVLASKIGLRPVRVDEAVRLERDRSVTDACVVHNYGHGGAGVTLSWGCAADVVGLVQEALAER